MSSKTRTRKTATADSHSTLRSVSAQDTAAPVRTDTEDKLWKALHTNPNSTAADLSGVAKIGKSTAQKILVKWATDGSVTRTPGIADGGRRAADIWSITEADPSFVPDTASDSDIVTDSAPADESTALEDMSPAASEPDDPTAASTTAQDPAASADAALADDDPAESIDAEPTADPAPATTAATDDTAPETAQPTDATPASIDQTKPGDAVADDTPETASGVEKAENPERLAPGALRGMVEDWLRDHPGEQAGPTKIAQELGGKSSGAVSNALDKLVADGVAVKTQDKPRRFGLAPTQREAATPPAN